MSLCMVNSVCRALDSGNLGGPSREILGFSCKWDPESFDVNEWLILSLERKLCMVEVRHNVDLEKQQ